MPHAYQPQRHHSPPSLSPQAAGSCSAWQTRPPCPVGREGEGDEGEEVEAEEEEEEGGGG